MSGGGQAKMLKSKDSTKKKGQAFSFNGALGLTIKLVKEWDAKSWPTFFANVVYIPVLDKIAEFFNKFQQKVS